MMMRRRREPTVGPTRAERALATLAAHDLTHDVGSRQECRSCRVAYRDLRSDLMRSRIAHADAYAIEQNVLVHAVAHLRVRRWWQPGSEDATDVTVRYETAYLEELSGATEIVELSVADLETITFPRVRLPVLLEEET
uniref:Uncharacterized protein n=1 Tax=mine drainage metagenome TaxID=410659 RepID=E6QPA4_9ZZZZ